MFKLQISSIFNFDRAHQSWISGLLGVKTKMPNPNSIIEAILPNKWLAFTYCFQLFKRVLFLSECSWLGRPLGRFHILMLKKTTYDSKLPANFIFPKIKESAFFVKRACEDDMNGLWKDFVVSLRKAFKIVSK